MIVDPTLLAEQEKNNRGPDPDDHERRGDDGRTKAHLPPCFRSWRRQNPPLRRSSTKIASVAPTANTMNHSSLVIRWRIIVFARISWH